MAGHSQFKNIMHRKGIQDAKRAKLFTKLLRDITIAAKEKSESKTRAAVELAKKYNVPKKNIDRAMECEQVVGDLIRYEGFVNGVGVIIEAITDNKNRTASSVRSIFTKYHGHLSPTMHLFREVYAEEFTGTESEVLEHSISLNSDEYIYRGENEWLIIVSSSSSGTKHYLPLIHISAADIHEETLQKFVDDMHAIDDIQDIWMQLE